ncbi:hypothetical protein [Dokdonella immobilis]|uniref:hypothetical protein n=1 Tax=Dokdonella immobilis TaxID=578942 RepID=UPI001114261D|nr:hypothetical protein [Dokdonella immobilis]
MALQIAAGEPLSVEDSDRFALACSRIDAAALILSGRDTWKPDYCFKPDRLIEIKRGAVAAIRRQLEGAEHELAEVSA